MGPLVHWLNVKCQMSIRLNFCQSVTPEFLRSYSFTVQFVLDGSSIFLFDFPGSDRYVLPFVWNFAMLVFDCFFIGLVLHSHRGLICFKSLVGFCTFAEAATVPPLTLNLAFLLLPPSGPGIIFFLAKLICGKKDLFLQYRMFSTR